MSDQRLENPPDSETPQEDDEIPIDWTTLPVAVPKDLKPRIRRVARKAGLTPSAWARLLLMQAVERAEAA